MSSEINVNISKRKISVTVDVLITTGSINSIQCSFTFDKEWDGLIKTALFQKTNGELYPPVLISNNTCMVPNEALKEGKYITLGVFGTNNGNVVVSTPWIDIHIDTGCYSEIAPPTEDIYLQILDAFSTSTAQVKESAQKAEQYAEEIKTSLPAIHQDAETAKAKAATAEAKAAEATASAEKAKTSEINAKASETASGQNLSDLLAMLGTDVATLVGGKIPAEQIPAIATTEVYTAATEEEMGALVAQNGDICIRTDENKSYIYKDTGWVYLASPTDYASNAGHADTADNAVNASMINGHRMVEMTAEEFETAVKDPNTYYLVG